MGFDMNGKTAGIIGTGKIARILIRILQGFGMKVVAYDLYPDENMPGRSGSLMFHWMVCMHKQT